MLKYIFVSCTLLAFYLKGEVMVADPSIFKDGNKYYLIGTESRDTGLSGDGHRSDNSVFPLLESDDLRSWRLARTSAGQGRVLNKKDAFADKMFWAPQLIKYKGKYYFAYTADFHWGIAVADAVYGPYKPYVEFPKQKRQAIDPFILVDEDGRVYAYYSCSNVGGCACVELSDDLKRFVGEPIRCITNDQAWERLPLEARYEELNRKYRYGQWERYCCGIGTTEGPSVIKRGGKYVLFYSANDFRSPDYCVGAAVADTPKGPWKKLQQGPVLWREQTGLNGTGHGDIFEKDGSLWYVFHAHNSGIKVSPRRTGIIRLKETFDAEGYPHYEAESDTMRLL